MTDFLSDLTKTWLAKIDALTAIDQIAPLTREMTLACESLPEAERLYLGGALNIRFGQLQQHAVNPKKLETT